MSYRWQDDIHHKLNDRIIRLRREQELLTEARDTIAKLRRRVEDLEKDAEPREDIA